MYQRAYLGKPITWFVHLFILIFMVGMAALISFAPSGIAQGAAPTSGPVVVRPGGAQLYSAPDGEPVVMLPTSTVFTANGRTEDQAWVVGQTTDGTSGWLRVEQVIAVGVDLLPVYDSTDVTPVSTADHAAVPEATPDPGDSPLMGTVESDGVRLNVRSGPSTAYEVIAKALAGESYPLIGRTDDATWLQIDRGDGAAGWVSAAYINAEGDVTRLPIVTESLPPPTPASMQSAEDAPLTLVQSSQNAAPSGAAVSDLSGTLVIQSSLGGMIYGYNLEGGSLWPLSSGFDSAISPDGQTVAFVRDGGENGIYLVDIDGSNERLIFSGRTRLSSPKWSPDGQWILFTRSDETNRCYELGQACIDAPVGPDGNTVDFGDDVERVTRYKYKLARVDRNGNNYRDIAALDTARAADWNEAGIVYQSAAGLQITTDTPDAQNQLVIYDYLKPFYDDPDWQPQGGRIVYMGKEASHWELFSVNPDGSGQTALTRPATTLVDELPSNVAPTWSPDGQHIVFLSNRTDSHEAGPWRVWVMEADGSNQRSLPIDLEITYTYGGEQALSWAP